MNLNKIGKLLTSKSVETGPSSYDKRINRAAVSQMLRNIAVERTTSVTAQRPTTVPALPYSVPR